MSRVGFTLIELIIVILIMGLVSFLVIKLPSFSSSKIKIEDLRHILYPNGTFYLFDDGKEIILVNEKKSIRNREDLEEAIKKSNINLSFNLPEVYVYEGEFKKKEFGTLFDKKIIFKYSVKNGIGDSFILKNGNYYYIFKPFYIKKANSFEEAKNEFLLKNFEPKYGAYY